MKYRYFVIILTAFLGTFLVVTLPASAYEFPPYQGLTLKILGNISESYSNNTTYALDRDNRVEDFETMLNFGLDFKYTGKRVSLGFSGNIQREIFESSSDVSNPSENARLYFISEVTEYDRISVSNDFTHTKVPGQNQGLFAYDQCKENNENIGLPSDIVESLCNEFLEEFGRFKGRFDSYSNSLNLNYSKTISEQLSVGTSYNYGQFWSDDVGTNDSDTHNIRLSMNYKYSQPTSFSLEYYYRISIFERGEDISRQSFTAGIKQYITRRLYFDGSIGADRTISGIGDDSIRGNATLTNEISNKTSATLSYSQGTNISANTDDTFENWKITGRLSSQLLEDLNGSISAFYGKGEYSLTNVTDTLLGSSINMSYMFWHSKRGSSMSGNLGYTYSDLDTTDVTRGYTRNSINTNLTLAF